MPRPLLSCSLLAVVCAGCELSMETPVSVADSIIMEPDTADFGFTGRWLSEDQLGFIDNPNEQDFDVRQLDDGSYELPVKEGYGARIRAIPLADDKSYALLEVRITGENAPTGTYLAIATAEAERLYVRRIAPRKLAKLMYEDNFPAVVEHHTFTSTIKADASELRTCIRNHSTEIVGKPTTYVRINH